MPYFPQRRRARWFALLAVIVAMWLGTVWLQARFVKASEASAFIYVRLNGFVTHGQYLPSGILPTIRRRLSGPAIHSEPTRAVGIPRNRMNNEMAKNLLFIRHLDSLFLYPPDLNMTGYKPGARSLTIIQSLRNVDLELSEESVFALRQRFPNLVIYEAKRALAGDAPEPGAM